MHLGSNLLKAFLEGIQHIGVQDDAVADLPSQQREHDHTNTFIHEHCKLFGRYGVPEYGCGNLPFPDFKLLEGCSTEDHQYYKSCSQVLLERQVGSRYFVSASNASKIFSFSLRHHFNTPVRILEISNEQYTKLQDPEANG